MIRGRGRRALAFGAVPLLVAALAGCASALRAPRPVSEIPGNPDGLTSADAVLEAVQARIRVADRDPDASKRRAAAETAVETVQWCGKLDPAKPDCAYWLGVALGLQARERPSTAVDAMPRMVEAFSRAAREAPGIDHAGPDRALALLYVRAPGWPVGPGDADKALEHARRAVELDPAHPPNVLALAEALSATGDETGSAERYREALRAARDATARGDADAEEWIREAERALDRK